jgi:hypothetical protein
MRKRNKLYTANKWNTPMFAQGVDREHQNIFDGAFSSTLNTSSLVKPGLLSNNTNYSNDSSWYSTPQLTKPTTTVPTDWSNGVQRATALGNSKALVKNFGKEASQKNIFSQYDASSKGLSTTAKAGLGAASIAATKIGQSDANPRGAYDVLDPVHQLAGGKESTVGNTLEDAGVSTFQTGAQTGNGIAMLAGAGLKIAGGAWNALGGIKTDKDRLNAINESIAQNQNYAYSDTLDSIQGPMEAVSAAGTYKGGAFSKGKAARKNADLQRDADNSYSWALRSMENNIHNLKSDQMNNMLANWKALGGSLDSSSGAIDYGFMSDYLTAKNKAAESKNKIPSNIFGSLQSPQTMFSLGGDIQSNSADFTTGLSHIDAGGSHEENPYEGVQVGISRENGMPNLVEEGETIFDDYVFSKRIKPDKQTKKKFHVGEKSNMSFADLSKKLEKESEERPNDPLSQAALTKQMHSLAEEQERQKAEEQKAEAEAMFESLPPEQQAAIMQQVAMEEQQAQQQQGPQDVQVEQPQMEEQSQQEPQQMVDEQMQTQQQGMEPQMEEQQVAANGGTLNRFDKGGELRNAIYKALGFYKDSQFDKWRKEQKLDDIDWENADKNTALWDAVGAKGAAIRNAIANGYDFGAYTPGTNLYDLETFNGKLRDYNASKTQGNKEGNYAIDKNFYLGDYKTIKELEDSDKYKAYTKYLTDLANRAKGARFLNPNIPEGKWKGYNDVFWEDDDKKLSEDDYNALHTLYMHTRGTSTKSKGNPVPLFNEDENGYLGLADNAAELIEKYRTDQKGGIFHMTPDMLTRGAETTNYVINDDGKVELIRGDVPKDLVLDNTFAWKTNKADKTENYYRMAPAKVKEGEEPKAEEEIYDPIHKSELPRQLGLFGPAVGLGMQMMGVGKPDYSRLDTALDVAKGAPALATYKPIGDYLQYKPMDIWYEQNRQNANARATDRAILNNSSPLTAKTAGLLANAYNNQIASGNLYRQALEYNDAMNEKKATFNRGTNQYNSEAFNTTSRTNAGILNDNRRYRAQMMLDNAKTRMDADASWNQGIYGNISKFFSNLGELGKENAQHNMIADMAADGLFGTLSDKQHISRNHIVKRVAAKGGKLNRRRGLTF